MPNNISFKDVQSQNQVAPIRFFCFFCSFLTRQGYEVSLTRLRQRAARWGKRLKSSAGLKHPSPRRTPGEPPPPQTPGTAPAVAAPPAPALPPSGDLPMAPLPCPPFSCHCQGTLRSAPPVPALPPGVDPLCPLSAPPSPGSDSPATARAPSEETFLEELLGLVCQAHALQAPHLAHVTGHKSQVTSHKSQVTSHKSPSRIPSWRSCLAWSARLTRSRHYTWHSSHIPSHKSQAASHKSQARRALMMLLRLTCNSPATTPADCATCSCCDPWPMRALP